MFIRSQNGKRLLNMDCTMVVEVMSSDRHSTLAFFDRELKMHHYLGYYSTEKQAIKILDEICAALVGTMLDCNGYHMPETIYQMPQDIPPVG